MGRLNLKNLLSNQLTEEEINIIQSSYDIIGSRGKAVAIMEIPENLKSKEKLLAETIMEKNKTIKSVLKKIV